MPEALRGDRDLADIFTEAYRIGPGSPLGVLGVKTTPLRGCGGFAHCRKIGPRPDAGQAATPEPVGQPQSLVSPVLSEITGSPERDPHRHDRPPADAPPSSLATKRASLVRHRLRLLSAPPPVLDLGAVATAHRATRDGFLFLEQNPAQIFAPKVSLHL